MPRSLLLVVPQEGKPNDQGGQDWGGVRQSQQGDEVLKPVLCQCRQRVCDVLEYHVSTSDGAEGQRGGRTRSWSPRDNARVSSARSRT